MIEMQGFSDRNQKRPLQPSKKMQLSKILKSFSDRNQKRPLQPGLIRQGKKIALRFSDRNQKRPLQPLMFHWDCKICMVSVIEIRSDRFNIFDDFVNKTVESFSDRNQKRPLQHGAGLLRYLRVFTCFSDRNQKRPLQQDVYINLKDQDAGFSDRNQKRPLQPESREVIEKNQRRVSVIEIRSDRFNPIIWRQESSSLSVSVIEIRSDRFNKMNWALCSADLWSFSDRNQKRPLQLVVLTVLFSLVGGFSDRNQKRPLQPNNIRNIISCYM